MQCLRSESLDQFFNGIQSQPVKLAVVGCGCSVATEPVAEISHRWNISQVIDLNVYIMWFLMHYVLYAKIIGLYCHNKVEWYNDILLYYYALPKNSKYPLPDL